MSESVSVSLCVYVSHSQLWINAVKAHGMSLLEREFKAVSNKLVQHIFQHSPLPAFVNEKFLPSYEEDRITNHLVATLYKPLSDNYKKHYLQVEDFERYV